MSVLSLSVIRYKIVLIRKSCGRNRPLAIHATLIMTQCACWGSGNDLMSNIHLRLTEALEATITSMNSALTWSTEQYAVIVMYCIIDFT